MLFLYKYSYLLFIFDFNYWFLTKVLKTINWWLVLASGNFVKVGLALTNVLLISLVLNLHDSDLIQNKKKP
jgi:hypothetical protein